MINTYRATLLVISMMCIIVFAENTYEFEQTNYDFLDKKSIIVDCENIDQQKLSSKHKAIVSCNSNKLCIKARIGNVCFKNEGAGDNIQRYSFLGMMPNHKVAVVRFTGYEEFFDYFISLDTGYIVLTLPSIYNGFIQTSMSPEQQFMMVVTTSNGYDGDPYLTEIGILSLVEDTTQTKICDESNSYYNEQDILCSTWPQEMGLVFKEQDQGPHAYNVIWLDNTTVKIQSLKSQNDYIILSQQENTWKIKEKSYQSWSDYDEDEGL